MLTFDVTAIQLLVEKHRRALNRVDAMQRANNCWGCGPIVNNFSGIQGAFFYLLGKSDRTPGHYPRDAGDGTAGATMEYFHPIVRIRRRKLQSYNPRALQGYSLQEPHDKVGWKWTKLGAQAVSEYVLRPKPMTLASEEDGCIEFDLGKSLSRLLCPTDILIELDKDNGIHE
jgi:hypothetical protein